MYSYGPPHMIERKQGDQLEHTFSSYVTIRDVVQKTCRRRWTIRKSGERGSGISVLPARHDDDDGKIKLILIFNDATHDVMVILLLPYSKLLPFFGTRPEIRGIHPESNQQTLVNEYTSYWVSHTSFRSDYNDKKFLYSWYSQNNAFQIWNYNDKLWFIDFNGM